MRSAASYIPICPCCETTPIPNRGEYDICEVCGWEDDPFQDENRDDLGANDLPLRDAKIHWALTQKPLPPSGSPEAEQLLAIFGIDDEAIPSTVFEHEVFNPDKELSIERPFDMEAPIGADIDISFSEADGVWIQANRAGFDYLARVFAELAVRKFDGPWHHHFDKNMRAEGPDMLTIEIAENYNGEAQ